MNFIFVTFDFPPTIGGIQTRGKYYVKELTKMGHKVIVFHMLKTYFENFDRHKCCIVQKNFGAIVYRLPASVKDIFPAFYSALQFIKKTRIDVVHILSGAYTPIGLLFLLYGKIKKKKTGISLYGKDILSSKHNPIDKILLRIALLMSDKIGVNSKATAHLLPKSIYRKISILYPGIDPQMANVAKETKKPNLKREILFVGRLVKRKGVDKVLKAFQLLQSKMPNTQLVIVGNGPQMKFLKTLAKELGIEGKVEFTGKLTGRPLFEKYSQCDLFVMPSERLNLDVEGFGMVFLEAALFRKPVVGTWSGGIPEAVIDGYTGILVKPGDVNALKDAMVLLLTNEELARKMGENAYNRVIKEFTWEKAAKKFLEMYDKN
jgi:phosphatidylinositol alpha-1,6-mannosyltransferase